MVARVILEQERVEAVDRLRSTLASLDGSNAEVVAETAARAGQGLQGTDYQGTMYLAEVVAVLEAQQARISELEKAAAPKTRGSRKRGTGSSSQS